MTRVRIFSMPESERVATDRPFQADQWFFRKKGMCHTHACLCACPCVCVCTCSRADQRRKNKKVGGDEFGEKAIN